ncbi:receptor-like protein 9DC3 [Alnus glutinosa]|uniref:receptor-like protein 9DC3 n=1 Tax=Alnus glutinosa TaxID=3517 RepID=UPI002D78C5DF|nr:receptor-like protein 9DC3 [Alnus glutinosa]
MGLPLPLFIFMPFLLVLSLLHLVLTHSSPFMQPPCHHDDSSALLQFKESLVINQSASPFLYCKKNVSSWTVEGDKSDCCSWAGVECDEDTGHVIGLDLSNNCLYGSINSNSSLFRLVHLQWLDLSCNDFNQSHIPSQVRDLTKLINLDLHWSSFSGQIPLEISQLSHLSSLDLSNNFMGSPDYPTLDLKKPTLRRLVANLTRLQKLDLSFVNISSTVPNILANLSSLTSLTLADCGLQGEFPIGIFMLPNLEHLNVGGNEGLTGYLPDFTWSSPLETLILKDTSFSGELPASIENLGNLTELDMSSCNFSGFIPSSIGNITELFALHLSSNSLMGNIPPSLGKFVQLFDLDVSHNQLTGPVPFEVINLPPLMFADLSYNLLHDEMHFELLNGTELIFLKLNNNRLSGPILTFVPTTLLYLDLSNNFFTSFGHHPTFLPLTELIFLDLKSNLLQGSLPIPPISTVHFDISNNLLTGNVPELFCNLRSLQVFDLANNSLSGSLPQCSDNFDASLSVLNLQRNKFQGSIPKTWIKGGQLKIINLSQNKFQGHLSRSLAKCTMLKVLDLSNNEFNDRFPSWLENLPSLEVLILLSNKFHGPIKTSKSEYMFPNLRIIDLSHNNFVGNLPLKLFGNCNVKTSETANHLTYIQVNSLLTGFKSFEYNYSMTMTNKGEIMFYEKVQELLMVVDISRNRFDGEISKFIENLRGFQLLNLSNNALTGHIPPSLGSLTELEALDLSQNMLSGKIPQQLTQLTFLEFFNISHNNFTGPIPRGKQFDTFENNSFEGNPGLCGRPLTKTCENSDELPSQPSISQESQDFESPFEFGWKIVVIGYGFGFALGVIIGPIVIARKHDWLMKTFRIRPLSRRRGRN